MASPTTTTTTTTIPKIHTPKITITYCTQCKWMLRAAYFAQELLSTFSTDIGEVSLVPSTGGIFTVTITITITSTSTITSASTSTSTKDEAVSPALAVEAGETQDSGVACKVEERLLWDRKRDGGFPEVKVLKSLVRNVIDPSRDLGHTDRALRAANNASAPASVSMSVSDPGQAGSCVEKEDCEDCQ